MVSATQYYNSVKGLELANTMVLKIINTRSYGGIDKIILNYIPVYLDFELRHIQFKSMQV